MTHQKVSVTDQKRRSPTQKVPMTNKNPLCFADDAGEDLILEVDTQNKKHCAYAPNILIPVSKGAKRILRYANPESVRVTTRFLWQT